MCSHYEIVREREHLQAHFGVQVGAFVPKWSMWPGQSGVFIRANHELVIGRWGLVPSHTSANYLPKALRLPTFNARTETVAKLYSFRHAWASGQRCIVPAQAIFEPDWRTGQSVPTRFSRTDGAPMGIAGLWDRYQDLTGAWQESYTMLTINADGHPLFQLYHRPEKEKRIVVILNDGDYEGWLANEPAQRFLYPYPAQALSINSPG